MYACIDDISPFSCSLQKPSPPYTILMKYLELVLYDSRYNDQSLSQAKAADTVLQLYADFSFLLLPQVMLNSWLDHSFTPGGLDMSPSPSPSR